MWFERMTYVFKKFIAWTLNPKWIVDETGCLGLRLCNLKLNLIYYKWQEPYVGTGFFTFAGKREFGESVRSHIRTDPRTPFGYIAGEDLRTRIGPAMAVFDNWHRHQTVIVMENGGKEVFYPCSDVERWLNGGHSL